MRSSLILDGHEPFFPFSCSSSPSPSSWWNIVYPTWAKLHDLFVSCFWSCEVYQCKRWDAWVSAWRDETNWSQEVKKETKKKKKGNKAKDNNSKKEKNFSLQSFFSFSFSFSFFSFFFCSSHIKLTSGLPARLINTSVQLSKNGRKEIESFIL